jgi:hypothetical protein
MSCNQHDWEVELDNGPKWACMRAAILEFISNNDVTVENTPFTWQNYLKGLHSGFLTMTGLEVIFEIITQFDVDLS